VLHLLSRRPGKATSQSVDGKVKNTTSPEFNDCTKMQETGREGRKSRGPLTLMSRHGPVAQ